MTNKMANTTLNVYSIFTSIDGEINAYHQGKLAVFIRLTGCNLKCKYCDTVYAQGEQQGRGVMTIRQILDDLSQVPNIRKVTITGGEPMYQELAVKQLVRALCMNGYDVTIETNGSYAIDAKLFPGNAHFVVDYKLSNSNMTKFMLLSAFINLRKGDFVKFVVGSREDFNAAIQFIKVLQDFKIDPAVGYAFSPEFNGKEMKVPKAVVRWMLEASSEVRNIFFSLQIHKIIGLVEDC